jgi:tripartite-type tricarboxylate transporter receptor subunit TctC
MLDLCEVLIDLGQVRAVEFAAAPVWRGFYNALIVGQLIYFLETNMPQFLITRVGARLLAAATLSFVSLSAYAQNAPLKIIVGFPAGGGADIFARTVADNLKEVLNRPVIVDNKPGAGGMIAAQQFKAMTGDANTILMGNDHQFSMVPLTMKAPGYSAKDFVPIAALATYRLALTVNANSPATDLVSYINRAKADPAQANYGVPAPGSLPQFVGFTLGQVSGAAMNVVPYRGGAPLNTDLLGGQIPASVDALGNVLAAHKDKKLRVLAVSGSNRSALAPEIPTFAEAGIRGLESNGWVAAYAAPGVSESVANAMAEALQKTLADSAVRDKLTQMGFEVRFMPARELAEMVSRDTAAWDAMVKRSGFALQ